MFLKSQIRFIHVAPKKYDFFRLLYESDRIEFLFGKIMKYLSGNIRFSSEYLFVSRGSLEPVYLLYREMHNRGVGKYFILGRQI